MQDAGEWAASVQCIGPELDEMVKEYARESAVDACAQTEPTSGVGAAAGNHGSASANGSGVFHQSDSGIGVMDHNSTSAVNSSRGGSDSGSNSGSAFDRLLKYGGDGTDDDAQFLARLLSTPPDARSSSSSSSSSSSISSSSSSSSASSSIRVWDRRALRRTIFHLYAQCVEQRADALHTGDSSSSSLVSVCNEYFLRHHGSRFAARAAFYNFCHRCSHTMIIFCVAHNAPLSFA